MDATLWIGALTAIIGGMIAMLSYWYLEIYKKKK